jgi:hypothetical protein
MGFWNLPNTFATLSGNQPASKLDDNFDALAIVPQYATAVSGTNAIALTVPLTFSSYAIGMRFIFVASGTNTGAATLNVNGIGTINIFIGNNLALVGGEILLGAVVECYYDGTNFYIVSAVSSRLNFQQTAFSLSSAVVTSVPNAAYTRINLTESFDPGNNIPVSANYYVAPATGIYFFYASFAVSATSAAVSSAQVALEKATNAGVNISILNMATSVFAAASAPQVSGSVILSANAGERFYLMGFHNNGGPRDAQAGGACYLGGWRIT